MKVHFDGRLIQVRHLQEKGGAYYFNPSSLMRKLGYTARALGRDLADAIDATEAFNLDWDRRRDRAVNRSMLEDLDVRYIAAREAGSVVYFIESGGHIKVGTSRGLSQRIKQMQIGSPMPLNLLGSVSGGRLEEATIHEALQSYRSHGEWFRDGPEVRNIIGQYLA